MYNIDFNKYTIDELKNFEKELINTIKAKENEKSIELLTNIIKALREFEQRFPTKVIGEFGDEYYYASEIANELERYNEDILEGKI